MYHSMVLLLACYTRWYILIFKYLQQNTFFLLTHKVIPIINYYNYRHLTIYWKPYPFPWLEVVVVGAEDTTWKVGWITKDVFPLGVLLLSCRIWAARRSFCCWSTGKWPSPSWVSWAEERSWVDPIAVRREPGLLRTEVVLPLDVLMPIWVGITWTWTVPVWELEEPLAASLTVVVTEVELEGLSVIFD